MTTRHRPCGDVIWILTHTVLQIGNYEHIIRKFTTSQKSFGDIVNCCQTPPHRLIDGNCWMHKYDAQGSVVLQVITYLIEPSHNDSRPTPTPYILHTMYHFVTEMCARVHMCIFLTQSSALRDMGLVRPGVCEIGLYRSCKICQILSVISIWRSQ